MDRKVWLFAIVGFAGALAMYKTSAQHASFADNGRLGRLARLEALMDEGKTQYRPSFFRKKVQAHVIQEQVAGLDPKPSSEVKAPTVDEAAMKKADADKKAAEEKKKADEKKKKEEEAKKKKKKKKKDDAAKAAAGATPDKSADDADKKPSDPSAGVDTVPAAAAGGGPGAYDPNKTPQSVDEWIAYLLTNPTFEKTTKFIQLKQIGTVSDEVFYPVVAKMLTIPTDTIRGYAVMALGATPSLPSLEMLFSATKDARFDDHVKQQVAHYLQIYHRVDYVQILASAAAVQTNVALNEFAISEIRQTLATNLAESSPSASGADPSGAPRAPASNTAKRYEAIAAILHNVANTSTDQGIRNSAAALASQIDSQIGQNIATNN